jgi:soluble lytic murein transglycosylase-like protein
MFDAEIQSSARKYNVPESWVKAVISTESSWNPTAYRAEPRINDASYGLMQLLYRTAKGLGYTGVPDGLYDPATNIDLGTMLLGQLRMRFGDDFRAVYSAYNSGSPSLWQTSREVAANVGRAVENLTKWIQSEVVELTAGAAEAGTSPNVVGLIVLVLLWAWAGKRK